MPVKTTIKSLKISGIIFIGILFLFSVAFASPVTRLSSDIQVNLAEKILVENPTQVFGTKLYTFSELRSFYVSVRFKANWVNNDSSYFNMGALMDMLNQAENDGLIIRDYHREVLKHEISLYDQWIYSAQYDSLADLDILLTDAALSYAEDISVGQLYSQDDNVNRKEILKPVSYVSGLKLALDSGQVCEWLRAMPPNRIEYEDLKNELGVYKEIYANGGWIKLDFDVTKIRLGDTGQKVIKLRRRLIQTGDLKMILLADSNIFDSALATSIRNFQIRFGIKPTGYITGNTLVAMNSPIEERIANIMGSIERLRWLPEDSGQKYVQVNISDFALHVVENHRSQLRMKVIVGKPYKQTPVFQATMKTVVINPSWEVPRSIISEEMLPKLQKNPGYLAHEHLKLLDYKGNEINPDTVKWSRMTQDNFKYRIVQIPGAWNSLGRVKFLFPNSYDVYLHGTPEQYLFAKDVRTFSHGCMRVENPTLLAACLLKDQGYDKEQIEEQIKEETETQISLKHHIPVYVTYLTAWVDDAGQLCFRNDIYNRDNIFLEYVIKHAALDGI